MFTSTQAAELLASALEAHRRARRDEALEQLSGCEEWPEAEKEQGLLLRAQVLTFRDPILGLQELAAHSDAFSSTRGKFGYFIASARAYTNSRNVDGAQEMLESAASLLSGPEDPLASELALHRMRLLWSTKHYDPHDDGFTLAMRAEDPAIRFSAKVVRAWMHAGLEEYREQLHELASALDMVEQYGYRCDLTMVSVALHALLELAFELGERDAVAKAEAIYEAIEWTADLQIYHFLCVRALAWQAFLEGDSARAQWLFKDSKQLAPTVAWKVMAHVDRAYVARMNGNEAWATEELYQAHNLARTVQWGATIGEERIALISLAVLFAHTDMAQAQRYVSTYIRFGTEGIDPTLGASHQRRTQALEKYASGRVQAVLGNRALAVKNLEAAYQIFSQIQHEFRAALAADALFELTRDEAWKRMAQAHALAFPNSALSRHVQQPSEASQTPALSMLSPVQRQIALAICDGCGIEELSRRFSRSEFTLKQQIKAIYDAVGVTGSLGLRKALARSETP